MCRICVPLVVNLMPFTCTPPNMQRRTSHPTSNKPSLPIMYWNRCGKATPNWISFGGYSDIDYFSFLYFCAKETKKKKSESMKITLNFPFRSNDNTSFWHRADAWFNRYQNHCKIFKVKGFLLYFLVYISAMCCQINVAFFKIKMAISPPTQHLHTWFLLRWKIWRVSFTTAKIKCVGVGGDMVILILKNAKFIWQHTVYIFWKQWNLNLSRQVQKY